MAQQPKIKSLEQQIKQLQVDKIELIRSTSTEIERLRQIIRTLTNPEANELNLDKLAYTPLTLQEKDKLSINKAPPPQNENIFNNMSNTNTTNTNTDTIFTTDATLNRNDPIQLEAWPQQRGLGSLREEKSYEYAHHKLLDQQDDDINDEHKTHRSADTMFRLNTKRMSYKGFEFGDFGFMTTDFDQLSRGHTQWVNQVMHHPVQNGIVITASDDWCVMFWRFKKEMGGFEGLKQEKINAKLLQQRRAQNIEPNPSNNYYIDPKLQHIVGEIDLLPVLKINTGLEVKAIGMSKDGSILACTCYDEEEDEGNPELQLYFDLEQNWTFKHHQFHPYYGNVGNRNKERQESNAQFQRSYQSPSPSLEHKDNNNNQDAGRLISRRIISLPFEPIPHCLCFSRDNKYVFVAMYSSNQILQELKEELFEEYGTRELPPDVRTWPDHPISLCCVNVHTQQVLQCEKIWEYMADDEHVSCMAISPNGARIAIGTSLGQLIVTGVLNLTNDFEDEEDFNPLLQKIWSSSMLGSNKYKYDTMTRLNPSNGYSNANKDDIDDAQDGSVTAIDWSADSEWIICGHASGVIKFWKKNVERRLSVQINRTLNTWMKQANVQRKNRMFECKWYLEGLHIEAINSLSTCGSLMVSGADDGNVVIHDLLETFIDSRDPNADNSPITIGRVEKIHGGRMVNSVSLTKTYTEDNLLVPSGGHFMVTSGADNIVHCVSLMDVCRETLRNRYSQQRINQQ